MKSGAIMELAFDTLRRITVGAGQVSLSGFFMGRYVCPNCAASVFPVRAGNVMKPHFRHRTRNPDCTFSIADFTLREENSVSSVTPGTTEPSERARPDLDVVMWLRGLAAIRSNGDIPLEDLLEIRHPPPSLEGVDWKDGRVLEALTEILRLHMVSVSDAFHVQHFENEISSAAPAAQSPSFYYGIREDGGEASFFSFISDDTGELRSVALGSDGVDHSNSRMQRWHRRLTREGFLLGSYDSGFEAFEATSYVEPGQCVMWVGKRIVFSSSNRFHALRGSESTVFAPSGENRTGEIPVHMLPTGWLAVLTELPNTADCNEPSWLLESPIHLVGGIRLAKNVYMEGAGPRAIAPPELSHEWRVWRDGQEMPLSTTLDGDLDPQLFAMNGKYVLALSTPEYQGTRTFSVEPAAICRESSSRIPDIGGYAWNLDGSWPLVYAASRKQEFGQPRARIFGAMSEESAPLQLSRTSVRQSIGTALPYLCALSGIWSHALGKSKKLIREEYFYPSCNQPRV